MAYDDYVSLHGKRIGITRSSPTKLVIDGVEQVSTGVSDELDLPAPTEGQGTLRFAAADSAGDTVTTVTHDSQAAAREYTIPDAGADADFVMTQGSQALAGTKTFYALQQGASAFTATADGTGTGAIYSGVSMAAITSGNADHIITLPAPTVGHALILLPAATGYELRTTNPATIAINGGTGAGAESAISAGMLVFLWCTSATTWQGFTVSSAGVVAAVQVAAA